MVDDLLAMLRAQDYGSLQSAVRNLIARSEKDIAQLDENIEQLRCRSRQLEFQKLQHEELIRQYKGMVTLARRVPSELLASIFELCVNDGWTLTPLVVSHVCSEWRKAAANPTVWSHVYVNCDARDPYGRTKFWLERAQGSMLCVTIEVHNDGTHLPHVIALLVTRTPQWRSLTIICGSGLHMTQLLSFITRPLSSLESINMIVEQETHSNNLGNDVSLLNTGFPEAPQLRIFRLRRTMLPPPRLFAPSITELYLDLVSIQPAHIHVSIDAVVEILRELPNLHTFSFSMIQEDSTIEADFSEANVAVVPNLRRLVLFGPPGLFIMLPFLRASALTSLRLISPPDITGYPHAIANVHLRKFIAVAWPPLQLLELRDVDISAETFSYLFSHLPELRELRLHESEIQDIVLKQLEGPDSPCPRLQILDLRWCNQVTGGALVELVKSRLVSGNDQLESISAITIINCAFVGDHDIIELAEMAICRLVIPTSESNLCCIAGCCTNIRYRKKIGLLARNLRHRRLRLVL